MAFNGEASKKFKDEHDGDAAEGGSQLFREGTDRKNSAEQTLHASSGGVRIQRDSLLEQEKSDPGMPATGPAATPVLPSATPNILPTGESTALDAQKAAALKKRLAELDNPDRYPRFLDCTFRDNEIKYLLQTSNGTSEWLSFKELLAYKEFRYVVRLSEQFKEFMCGKKHRDEYFYYVAMAAGIMPPAEYQFLPDEENEHWERFEICFAEASKTNHEILTSAAMAPEMLKDLETNLLSCVDGNLAKEICQKVLPPTWSELRLRSIEQEKEKKQRPDIRPVNGIRRHAASQAWLKRQWEHLLRVMSAVISSQKKYYETVKVLDSAVCRTVPSQPRRGVTIRRPLRLDSPDEGSQSALTKLGDVPNDNAHGQGIRTAGLVQEQPRAQNRLTMRAEEESTEDDSILDTAAVGADRSKRRSESPEWQPPASPEHDSPVKLENSIAAKRGRRAIRVRNYDDEALEVETGEQAGTVRANPQNRGAMNENDTPARGRPVEVKNTRMKQRSCFESSEDGPSNGRAGRVSFALAASPNENRDNKVPTTRKRARTAQSPTRRARTPLRSRSPRPSRTRRPRQNYIPEQEEEMMGAGRRNRGRGNGRSGPSRERPTERYNFRQK